MKAPGYILRVALLAAWCGLVAAGCNRAPQARGGKAGETEPAEARIACLAPALSQMLVEMGVGDAIVAKAANDSVAPAGAPVVYTFPDQVAQERLLAARPTLVLMMTGQEGVPEAIQAMADRKQFALVTFPSPNSLNDVMEILVPASESTDGARRGLGAVLGQVDLAREAYARFGKQLQRLAAVTRQAASPNVLLVIGTSPLVVCGPRTAHSDILVYYLNARNAARETLTGAPSKSREAVLRMKPEVILLLLPDGPPLGTLEDDPRLADFRGLDIPAVKNGRIWLINDPLTLLPSTSLARIAAQMGKAIYPELAGQIDRALGGADTQPAATQPASPGPESVALRGHAQP